MPILAATATAPTDVPGLPVAVLVLAAVLVTLGYALRCLCWPFRACGWCDGTGKRRSATGRAYRFCRHCDGTGLRLRLGRRAWNATRHWRGSTR